jgi:hypothetical protein
MSWLRSLDEGNKKFMLSLLKEMSCKTQRETWLILKRIFGRFILKIELDSVCWTIYPKLGYVGLGD